MNAQKAGELLRELAQIERDSAELKKALAADPAKADLPLLIFDRASIPVSFAVMKKHAECYLYDLEVRADSIKQQLNIT